MSNRVCEVLGIEKPIIQGPMSWSSFAPLVAAVSNAGGLGVLGVAAAPNNLVKEQIEKTRELTDKPFGVNVFLIPELVDQVLPLILEVKPPIVYADNLIVDEALCRRFYEPLKEAGIKIIQKVGDVKTALLAQRCGVDVIVAKGWEGGGHLAPEATFTLLPQVVDAVNIPVVGSGGIADGRGMAAAISLGVEGIEMGTAFLCADECTIHENAKQAIINQKDSDSVITFVSIGQPCRQIPNKLSDEAIHLEADHRVSEVAGKLNELFKPSLKNGMHDGDTVNGAVMSGMVGGMITKTRPVSEIIDSTIAECKEVIKKNTEFAF